MSAHGQHLLYVGKTKHSALDRRNKHIQNALSGPKSNTNLSHFIKCIKPHNLGVLPLQHVTRWDFSHYFERLWIHKLNTHSTHNQSLPLNNSPEHQPLKPITHNRSKHSSQSPPQQSQYHPLHRTIHHLIETHANKAALSALLMTMNIKKLYQLASILLNKRFHIYASPTPLSAVYRDLHNHISAHYPSPAVADVSRAVTTAINTLRNQFLLRHNKSSKTATFSYLEVITLPDFQPLYKSLDLPAILKQHAHLLPPAFQHTHLKIVYRNGKPTSRTLFNHKETALRAHAPPLNTCICHHHHLQPYVRESGHIDTTSLSILSKLTNNKALAYRLHKLMKRGTKYIEHPAPNSFALTRNIDASLEKHSQKILKHSRNTDPHQLLLWKSTILQHISNALKHLPQQRTQPFLSQPPTKAFIAKLHHHFVISNGDKLPNNYTISCKHWWYKSLIDSTIGPQQKMYKTATASKDAILLRHQVYLEHRHFKFIPELPYKRISSKYHKSGLRPLTSATNVSTTHIAKTLTIALTALIDSLREEAQIFELHHGFTWFLDIENAADLTLWLESLNRNPTHKPTTVHTADATGYYDSIAHSHLIKLYRTEIPGIFQRRRRRYLIITSQGYEWATHPTNNTVHKHCFNDRALINLLQWKLKNQFIRVGPHIVQQLIGVAQGDNHSGHQSRFFAICHERDFLLQLHAANPDLAKRLSNMRRKHDDLIFVNCPDYKQYVHIRRNSPGLYPYFIKLSETNTAPYKSATYLDTTVSISNNTFASATALTTLSQYSTTQLVETARRHRIPITKKSRSALLNRIIQHLRPQHNYHAKRHIWTTATYSKRTDFINKGLKPVAYIHYSSNTPLHVKRGVITGRLHSLLTTNSHFYANYVTQVVELFKRLSTVNGYPQPILFSCLRSFLHKVQPAPYHVHPAAIYRHVQRGLQTPHSRQRA